MPMLRRYLYQKWSQGHNLQGQDQGHKKNPRPRTDFLRTDSLKAKDRNARGQGQGPRTQFASVLQKKRGLQNFFQATSKKNKNKTRRKKVLADFLRGFCRFPR